MSDADATPRTRKRSHKAAGARVAASGIGAGALLGIVGAFGAQASPTAATSSVRTKPVARAAVTKVPHHAPTTTPTTIVWRVVHRVVVVVDAPAHTGSASGGSVQRSYAPQPSSAGSPAPAPAPLAGPTAAPAPVAAPPVPVAPTPAPPPAPTPAPPACSGSKCP